MFKLVLMFIERMDSINKTYVNDMQTFLICSYPKLSTKG